MRVEGASKCSEGIKQERGIGRTVFLVVIFMFRKRGVLGMGEMADSIQVPVASGFRQLVKTGIKRTKFTYLTFMKSGHRFQGMSQIPEGSGNRLLGV